MSEKKFDAKKWQQEQEQAQQKRLVEKLGQQGRSTYLRLEEGENKITLLKREPFPQMSKWGKDQMVFKVQKDGAEYDWPVTTTSPLYMQVVRKMTRAPTELKIVRLGQGMQTRLSLVDT